MLRIRESAAQMSVLSATIGDMTDRKPMPWERVADSPPTAGSGSPRLPAWHRLVGPSQDAGTEPRPVSETVHEVVHALPRPPVDVLRPGSEVDYYRLVRRLGRGQSAEVWEAEVVGVPPGVALRHKQRVAVKFYSAAGPRNLLRRDREFRVARELDHENVVKVYDLMLCPSRPWHEFLVMEYVRGELLKSRIPERGMAPGAVREIGLQLLAGVAAIHSMGALHRDIKPANVLLMRPDKDGTPARLKLLDLGIVYVEEELSLTESSVFLGSKHYSSPEQLRGREIDARSDIYSVGATLYHCCTGRAMYEGSGPAANIAIMMKEAPQLLPIASASCPALHEFINRCLDQDPVRRPESASTAYALLAKVGSCVSDRVPF